MAKKYLIAALLATCFVAAYFAINTFNKSSESVRLDRTYTWYADSDAAGRDVLVKGRNIGQVRMDVNKLVQALNRATADGEASQPRTEGVSSDVPVIQLEKLEQQTAYVSVVNDQYLTQSMGSSGAQGWLAGVTYTLTENPNIRAVNFSFAPGDHAMPGLYSRETFTGYRLSAPPR